MSISAKATIPGNSTESIYDIMNNYSLNIDEEIAESIMSEPYSVPMCPPGWPNPPLIETE